MSKHIWVIFSIFISFISYSQFHLKGQVFNDTMAIPFAKVWLNEGHKYAITDLKGMYDINFIPEGKYQLFVEAAGYEKYEKAIFLSKDTLINIPLTKIKNITEEVVVTGSMKAISISESAVKIELLNRTFFKTNPTNSFIDALETVNGVQQQVNCGVCGTNDIHINGMEGPYTLVLIDGSPIMGGLSSTYGLNGIPTSIIQQVEIIKGPSSTLYGTQSVGGIINIITKTPQQSQFIEFESRLNSDLQFSNSIAFSPQINNRLSTILSIDHYYNQIKIDKNHDNFTDIPLTNRLSIFNKWQIMSKNKTPLLNVSARYYHEERHGGVLNWTKNDIGSSTVYGEYIQTKRAELNASYFIPTKKNHLKLDFSSNYHFQNSYYGNTHYSGEQAVVYSNLMYFFPIKKRHQITSGYTNNYQYYADNSQANVNKGTFVPGVYAQDEFHWTEQLLLLVGARLDYHNEHGLIFSPRVNLKKDFGEYTSLRINYGNGFRQVNLFTEDHAFLTGSREVIITEELKPERSHNLTINLNHTYNWLGYGNLDLDLFYTYFDNKITPDYDTDPQLIIYKNLNGYGISRGASFAINHKFNFPLRLRIGSTFQNVFNMDENDSGELEKKEQLFTPVLSGVFNASYTITKWNLKLNYTGKIVGPQHLPTYEEPYSRAEISPWYTLQHIQVIKTFNNKWEIYGGLKNVFNYTQDSPLIDPENPFGDDFDTAYAYGPLQGRRVFFGIIGQISRK